MRNIYCGIADMRKQVFAEVARLAYEGGDYHRVDKLPHKILPDEPGNERDSIFLERAIVAERIRLPWPQPALRLPPGAPVRCGRQDRHPGALL